MPPFSILIEGCSRTGHIKLKTTLYRLKFGGKIQSMLWPITQLHSQKSFPHWLPHALKVRAKRRRLYIEHLRELCSMNTICASHTEE